MELINQQVGAVAFAAICMLSGCGGGGGGGGGGGAQGIPVATAPAEAPVQITPAGSESSSAQAGQDATTAPADPSATMVTSADVPPAPQPGPPPNSTPPSAPAPATDPAGVPADVPMPVPTMKYHYKLGTVGTANVWDLQSVLEKLNQPVNAGYRFYAFTAGDLAAGYIPIYESVSTIPSYSFAGVESMDKLDKYLEFGAWGYLPGNFTVGIEDLEKIGPVLRRSTIMSKPSALNITYQYNVIEATSIHHSWPNNFVDRLNSWGSQGYCQGQIIYHDSSTLYLDAFLRREIPVTDKCEYESVPAAYGFKEQLDQLKSQGARGYYPAFKAGLEMFAETIYVRNLRRNSVIGYYETSLKVPDRVWGLNLALLVLDEFNRQGAKGAVPVHSEQPSPTDGSHYSREIKTIYRVAAECIDSACATIQLSPGFLALLGR